MNVLRPGKPDQAAPVVGMIAILAGALGVYFWVEPLRTFRPPGQEEPRPPLEHRLPARLWQDPIQQARENLARTKLLSEPAQGQVPRLPDLAPDARVLAVTVYGGYGQLDQETRLRSRYAVELALNDEGYVPDGEDTGFLRFLVLDWDEDGPASRKVVPFEVWWSGGPVRGPSQILVLWVDDTLLGEPPRSRLRKLIQKAGLTGPFEEGLRMIGPSSSSGLKDLLQEGGQWPQHIHSPWATADEVFLFAGDVRPEMMRGIDRTIATDRQACGTLLAELGKRDIRLRKRLPDPLNPGLDGADTIAVLSEWDTVYGRALPVTFAACVLTAAAGKNCGEAAGVEEFRANVRALVGRGNGKAAVWPPEIRRVVYLRGLDGIGPRSPGQAQKPESRPSLADMERPDGTSQLDYARRLADRLSGAQSTTLRGVGVLGADIYDKLLLLQALRERLPGVFFFTTDLDAGYLHPSQNEWSRNLLVASGFGLSETSLQQRRTHISPPFRDTYGVAIQRAVRHAVSGTNEDAPSPSLYEIGRTAAHRLGPETPGVVEGPSLGGMWRKGLWLFLFMLLAGVLLMMHVGRRFIWWWLAALAFLFVLLIILALGMPEEPFFWLEGISIWPTEIIRLLAAAAALLALYQADSALQANSRELRQAARFAEPPPPLKTARRWYRLPSWRKLLTEAPPADAQVEAQSLWHDYEEAGHAASRRWRAGSLAGFILLVIGVTLLLDRPTRPCRGEFSCGLDLGVSALSIAALLLTTCYVFDATATCTRWIRRMVSVRTTWPGAGDASAADLPGAWHEVEIVARRTQVVGHLILYPFAFLLLLILSRSEVFDRWPWPLALVIMFSLPLGLALISALLVRGSAEQLREKAYAEVRELWAGALRAGDSRRAELSEIAMKSIAAEARGAFSPFTQNPALAAILLPLGGAGTGLALEKLIQNL